MLYGVPTYVVLIGVYVGDAISDRTPADAQSGFLRRCDAWSFSMTVTRNVKGNTSSWISPLVFVADTSVVVFPGIIEEDSNLQNKQGRSIEYRALKIRLEKER